MVAQNARHEIPAAAAVRKFLQLPHQAPRCQCGNDRDLLLYNVLEATIWVSLPTLRRLTSTRNPLIASEPCFITPNGYNLIAVLHEMGAGVGVIKRKVKDSLYLYYRDKERHETYLGKKGSEEATEKLREIQRQRLLTEIKTLRTKLEKINGYYSSKRIRIDPNKLPLNQVI